MQQMADATGDTPQVCVIGAGASGLAAGKALADRGIIFDWFEKGSYVGGLWQIDNDNDAVAAYRTLHLNSSRPLTQYPSFPMPDDWPDYPSHELMATYFQSFAEANGLLDRITFRTSVISVTPVPTSGKPGSAGWDVELSSGDTRHYQDVVLANGHHSVPNIPEFPGQYSGESFHAHDYLDPSVFDGRNVLVIGVGNSGMDIACDAAKNAESVLLSTRHGVHVIPKYAFGRPVDQFGNPLVAYLPFPVERAIYEGILRLSTGRPQDRGLPQPDHRLLHAHPTVSSELYDRVGHGDIEMKPDIARFDGDRVEFVDGSSAEIDLLVYATGYQVSLPFFAPEVYEPRGNSMPLYQRVLTPDRPGLFFIGFIQTVGSGIPLMELQAQWVGDLLTGTAVLPSDADMREWIAADQKRLAARYVRSTRHTMQVDFWRYRRALIEARLQSPQPSLRTRLTRPFAGLR